jgi:SAM-dependent methyltransferase
MIAKPSDIDRRRDAFRPKQTDKPKVLPRVLNVGAGSSGRSHPIFAGWEVTTLDIDPRTKPDVLGSITDLSKLIPNASFDAIWSSHNIEHVASHEVPRALAEFRRALKKDGFALITCPDLQQVAQAVLAGDIDRVLYTSPAGPISAIDIIYGHGASIKEGFDYMAHRTGFTVDRLGKLVTAAGFSEAWIAPGTAYDLWAVALMPSTDKVALHQRLSASQLDFLRQKP